MIKVKGISIDLAGTKMVVAPLSLGSVEVLQERIEKFVGGNDPHSITTIIDCLHASLQRNYPDIKREDVAAMVGFENAEEVMHAVMDKSGLRRKQIEADEALAAEKTGNQMPPIFGGNSMPESSPTLDTLQT